MTPEQFTSFIEVYRPTLISLTVRLYQLSNSDAEDVVQDSIILALANLHTYRAESGFVTWISAIVKNKALKFLRRQRVATKYTRVTKPDTFYFSRPITGDGEYFLSQLSKEVADYLILQNGWGLAAKEAAKRLDIPLVTIRTKAKKELVRLRKRLEREGL